MTSRAPLGWSATLWMWSVNSSPQQLQSLTELQFADGHCQRISHRLVRYEEKESVRNGLFISCRCLLPSILLAPLLTNYAVTTGTMGKRNRRYEPITRQMDTGYWERGWAYSYACLQYHWLHVGDISHIGRKAILGIFDCRERYITYSMYFGVSLP